MGCFKEGKQEVRVSVVRLVGTERPREARYGVLTIGNSVMHGSKAGMNVLQLHTSCSAQVNGWIKKRRRLTHKD